MRFLSTVLLLMSVTACGFGLGVPGSGVSKTESRSLPEYRAVSMAGAMTVQITLGAPPSFEITADDNLLPLIETRVEGGRLVVKPTEIIVPKTDIVLTIVVEALDSVDVAGALDVEVKNLSNASFAFEVAGSSEVTLSGRTEQLSLDVAGSADIHALQLEAKDVTVDVAGSAEVDVHATGTLAVGIAGSAEVRYRGKAKVTQDVAGAGSISHIDG